MRDSADLSLENATGFARARLGLIVPSSNRMSEPQFRAFLPSDVAVHVTRLRMTGPNRLDLDDLLRVAADAARALGDAKCDAIVFHCTANSMEHGPDGERAIVETIRAASGAQTLTTAQAVTEALRASAIRKLVLVSPYAQAANDHEIAYLRATGFETIHDVALAAAGSDAYIAIPPSDWVDVVRANLRDDADGYFLSCTNTTQIDAVAALEAELGKPVVNSNQATIWAALRRLEGKLGALPDLPRLGGLMRR